MTGAERLWAFCQLKLQGYTREEAEEIIEKVEKEMEEAKES